MHNEAMELVFITGGWIHSGASMSHFKRDIVLHDILRKLFADTNETYVTYTFSHDDGLEDLIVACGTRDTYLANLIMSSAAAFGRIGCVACYQRKYMYTQKEVGQVEFDIWTNKKKAKRNVPARPKYKLHNWTQLLYLLYIICYHGKRQCTKQVLNNL